MGETLKHSIAQLGQDGAPPYKERRRACKGCLPPGAVHAELLALRKAHPDWPAVRLQARATIDALKKG